MSHSQHNTRVIKQGITTQYQGHETGLSNYVTVVYGWHAGQTVWPAVSVEELRVRESCPSSIPVSFVEIVGREWHLKGVESVEKIALTGIYRRLGESKIPNRECHVGGPTCWPQEWPCDARIACLGGHVEDVCLLNESTGTVQCTLHSVRTLHVHKWDPGKW